MEQRLEMVASTEQDAFTPELADWLSSKQPENQLLQLLLTIHGYGAIADIADELEWSEQQVWEGIANLNNLASELLVLCPHGLLLGGGVQLTEAGESLVRNYRQYQRAQQAFFTQLQEMLSNPPKTLAQLRRLSLSSSARNQLCGVIGEIRFGERYDEVEMILSGQERITAQLTHTSLLALGLHVGKQAIALIKASWIIVTPIQHAFRFSTSNQLHGTIQRIINHALEREIAIQLDGGNVIYAQQGHTSFSQTKSQRWQPGDRVEVVIDASSVILGVAN